MTNPLDLRTQAERWGAEAKRLADAGNDDAALELYRKAADLLPGAPWLQQRTAELARKLSQHDVALLYYRQSAEAFLKAGFAKRALPPLRSAWCVAREGLPASRAQLLELSKRLSELQKSLGFLADAEVTLDHTSDALRKCGVPVENPSEPPQSGEGTETAYAGAIPLLARGA